MRLAALRWAMIATVSLWRIPMVTASLRLALGHDAHQMRIRPWRIPMVTASVRLAALSLAMIAAT